MSEAKGDAISTSLVLDLENYHDGAMRVLSLVRPKWDQSKITVKEFTNGITNKMLGFINDGDNEDTVLIRINGNKTEIFLDRDNEVNSFKILHNAGCAPNLYCVFNNGLCYEFIKGNTTHRDQIRKPEIFKLEGYTGPSEEELRAEAAALEEHLMQLGSPIVFCHNDLLLNNIIFNEKQNSIHFIDYEYAGLNNQAFDIGNHFCEFAGVDEIDYSFYPDRELQYAWLREYLKHWNATFGVAPVTELEIEKLYVQVNKFALAANLMWGSWALVQAKFSSIDFDYIGYAMERLGEYFKRKDEFLALKMP